MSIREDEEHLCYTLHIPNITSFGSYKVYKENWLNNWIYRQFRKDTEYHLLTCGYDSDEDNIDNYELKTRFDFGLSQTELTEVMKKVKYFNQRSPYIYKVLVAGQPYYAADKYKEVDCRLGIYTIPKPSKTAYKPRLPPVNTTNLQKLMQHRQKLYE